MKLITLAVLILSLHTSVHGVSPCSWRFAWTDEDLPLASGDYSPPTSTECALFASDSLGLVNEGTNSQLAFRVTSQAALNACNISDEVLSTGARNVTVPAGSVYSLTLSRGMNSPWNFLLNEDVYMIGEERNGSCLKLSFSIHADVSRDCNIVRTNGECGVFPPTTPTLSTSPTSTTMTTVTTETSVTTVTTETTETTIGTQTTETSTQIQTTTPTPPGSLQDVCSLDVDTSYCYNNTRTILAFSTSSIQFSTLDYDVTIHRVPSHANSTHCNLSLVLPGSLTLPRNVTFALSLSPGNSPWNFSVDPVNFLVSTDGPCPCIRLAVMLTTNLCQLSNPDNKVIYISVFVASGMLILIVIVTAGGGATIWCCVRTKRFWITRDVKKTGKTSGEYAKISGVNMTSISSDT